MKTSTPHQRGYTDREFDEAVAERQDRLVLPVAPLRAPFSHAKVRDWIEDQC